MKAFLTKEIYGLKVWWLLPPLAVSLILLLLGTFQDLVISQAIVNQRSPFGVFMEGWGILLPCIVAVIGAAAASSGLFRLGKVVWKVIGVAIFLAMIIATGYIISGYIREYYSGGEWTHELGTLGKVLSYVIGFAFVLAPGIPCFFLFQKKDVETLIRGGLAIVLLFALQAALLEILKRACYRPRFRFIAGYVFDEDGELSYASPDQINLFRAWYEGWRWFDKPDDIPDPDVVKSFPSGHTGSTCVLLLSPILLSLFGLPESKKKILVPITYLFGIVYLGLLGFSRIRVGAHFLSDISMSIIINVVLGIAIILINKKIKSPAKLE